MYVTNGIMHAKKLTQKGCIVYLIGGELKEATLALVGEEAMKTLGRYHFTKGFFGTNGIHIESGCTTPDIREAAIKEMAILRSAKAYILADSTKFGQVAPVTFSELDAVDIITTKLKDATFNKYKKYCGGCKIMIYTVTFNPSLDYVVQADQLIPGEINRTTSEHIYPGGKGNNVSVILSNLGLESTAFGFTAGFTGKALQEMLLEFGAKTDFIPLADGQTRINVKINAGQETEINGQGPKITETAIQELFEKLKSLKAGDVLVLAGSIPSTLPENIYEWILMCLKDKDVKVVVDATKDLLLNVEQEGESSVCLKIFATQDNLYVFVLLRVIRYCLIRNRLFHRKRCLNSQ